MTDHDTTDHDTSRSPWRAVVSWVVVPVLVAVLGLAAVLWGQDLGLATSRAHQRYAELYFVAPDAIRRAVARQDALPVSFVIHNREGRATSYRYAVSLDGRTVLNGTTGNVADSAACEVDARVPVARGAAGRAAPGRLEVRLLPSGPSVHLVLDAADPDLDAADTDLDARGPGDAAADTRHDRAPRPEARDRVT